MGQKNSPQMLALMIYFLSVHAHTPFKGVVVHSMPSMAGRGDSGSWLPKMFAFEENYMCGKFVQLHRDGSSKQGKSGKENRLLSTSKDGMIRSAASKQEKGVKGQLIVLLIRLDLTL